MTKNVEVNADGKENSMGLLKKFSQKMRTSGVVQRVKSIRYNDRKLSDYKIKKEKLRKMAKLEKMERDIKLGKKTTGRR
jgi:hypothetical protein